MIEEFLSWVQLISHHANQIQQILTAKSQSNFILLAYIATLNRSYIFCAAFVFSEITTKTNVFSLAPTLNAESTLDDFAYHGAFIYLAICLTWTVAASLHIHRTTNKNTLIACGTMILFILIMATDSYINADTETFIWRNYENIILCIHVCIILSLYNTRAIFNGLVDKLLDLVRMLRNNYAFSYFWYTVQKWQSDKRS